MMKVHIDTEAGSRALAGGSLPQMMQEMFTRLQPEAAYFGPDKGVRTAFLVFDLKDPSQLPATVAAGPAVSCTAAEARQTTGVGVDRAVYVSAGTNMAAVMMKTRKHTPVEAE